MKIEKDISDLSKFIDGIQGEVVDFMDEKAREAVKLQQVEANYRNHTWNLRSSLGYVVTYDGKEKRRYISGMNYGDEAAEAIKKWLEQVGNQHCICRWHVLRFFRQLKRLRCPGHRTILFSQSIKRKRMKRDLLINGYDAYAMGIAMGSGFIASLRAPASLKDFVENDDPKKDGKQVIYPEEPKVAARDLTLTFVIFGDTLTEHTLNYNSFIELLKRGKMDISVPLISADIYHLTYIGNSGSYMMSADLTTSQLTVKFNEPNPANRVAKTENI